MTNNKNNFELEELRNRVFLNKRLDKIKIETKKKNIEKLKNDLNDNERVIISRRKLKEKQDSLSEVGKSIGLTAERVRQIENSAIKKLRSKLISNLKLAS